MPAESDNVTTEPPSSVTQEFKYNFINTPWDKRQRNSKIGMIALLLTMFLAIMVGSVANFLFQSGQSKNPEINCNLVQMGRYPFVARIHSAKTKLLTCVAAVLGDKTVLAHDVCTKGDPVLIYVGSLMDPQCRKGYPVAVNVTVAHDGVYMSRLVVLRTYESLAACSAPLRIRPQGKELESQRLHIYGRPFYSRTAISRRPVTALPAGAACANNKIPSKEAEFNYNSTICVRDVAPCPLRAGDLLSDGGSLHGIAATSVFVTNRNKLVAFADVALVAEQLMPLVE